MRALAVLLATIQLCDLTVAHYTFARFLVNNTITPDWKYVRKHVKKSTAYPWYAYTNMEDMRCNILENNSSWADVDTLTLDAGTTIGAGVIDWAISDFKYLWHAGPAQAYLSRAPNDNLSSYVGDGEWFKLGQYGYASPTHWVIDGCDSTWKSYANCTVWMNYTIPASTPPGKYLLRVEHLFNDYAGVPNTQFYHSCAHVEIVGRGGGTPGPTIKIPEDYMKDPGIDFTEQQAYATWGEKNFTDYKNPGPIPWIG